MRMKILRIQSKSIELEFVGGQPCENLSRKPLFMLCLTPFLGSASLSRSGFTIYRHRDLGLRSGFG